MNVFLGCYVPKEKETPLWDLEGDNELHNKLLHPPEPLVNKVLFNEVVRDIKKINGPGISAQLETSIKEALKKSMFSETGVLIEKGEQENGDQSSRTFESTISAVRGNMFSPADLLRFIRTKKLPPHELENIDKKYFIRNLRQFPSSQVALSDETAGAKKTELRRISDGTDTKPPKAVEAKESGDSIHSTTYDSFPPVPPAGTVNRSTIRFTSRNTMKDAIRAVARMEKRKIIKSIAKYKLIKATQFWWRNALEYYDNNLYEPVPQYERTLISDPTKAASYYDRVYQPLQISSFDELLSLDFLSPINGVGDLQDNELVVKNSRVQSNASIVYSETIDAMSHSKEGNNTLASAKSTNSSPFVEKKSTGEERRASTEKDDNDENDNDNDNVNDDSVDYLARLSMNRSFDEQGNLTNTAESSSTVFQLGKYMREIGQKARTLVGGLLRQNDFAIVPQTVTKAASSLEGMTQVWIDLQQQITFPHLIVPKHSISTYSKYVLVHRNNLLLLDDKGLARASEEEYFLILRDHKISSDNVIGMEQLSIDSYISFNIFSGIYKGMNQYFHSTYLSHAFLFLSLNYFEFELLRSLANYDEISAVENTLEPKSKSHLEDLAAGKLEC